MKKAIETLETAKQALTVKKGLSQEEQEKSKNILLGFQIAIDLLKEEDKRKKDGKIN